MIVLLLKVSLLWMLALAVQPLLRRCSAATRHLVYACALGGSLLLPLTLLAPAEAGAFRIDASGVVAASRAALPKGVNWPVAGMLAGMWAIGCGWLLLRIAAGHFALSRLLRKAEPLGGANGARVYFADISVPVAAGLWRPVVLLPRAAEAWPESQRRAALRHELQHVERKDLWTMLLGHFTCAVYWFHPLAWALAGRSRQEQESACDDAVIASGFEPASYAEALVAAAHHLTSTRLIGCHMLTRKTLKFRIARLFDSGLARIPSRAGLRGAALASVAAIALVGMLVGARPAVGQSGSGQGVGGDVFKVGNGVTAPSVRHKVEPDYAEQAKNEGLEGTVLLSVVIGTDGIAHDINVVKPLGSGLDQKAVDAVQQWLFNPGTKNGETVKVRAQIEINFRLK